MLNDLADRWWLALLRGLAGIAFGVLCLVWPIPSLFALVLLFGVYMLLDGSGAIGFAIAAKRWGRARVWPFAAVGVLSILAGVVAIAWPGITAVALLVVIAVWAIAHGIFEIIAAVQLRKEIEHEWALALAGILSITFGGLLLRNPGAGALALVWLVGAFAIAFGALNVALGLRLRALPRRITRGRVPAHGSASAPA